RHRVINHVLFAANPDRRILTGLGITPFHPAHPLSHARVPSADRQTSRVRRVASNILHPSSETHTFGDPLSTPHICCLATNGRSKERGIPRGF
ncbi:unnamed protein product, partial [Ectocarpus sp. 4 AP-2014]